MPNAPTKLPKTAFSFLLFFVRKQRLGFWGLALSSIVWALNDTFFPFFLRHIVDHLENFHGHREQVFVSLEGTLVLLALFWIANEIAGRSQGIISLYTFPHFRANIRESVFDYVKSHSQDYFSKELAGNLANKLADLPLSCQTLMEIICFQFVTAGIGSIIVLVMMWQVNPLFAGLILFWLFLHLSFSFLFMVYGSRSFEVHSRAVTTLSGKIVDVFTNIMTVRLFARGAYEGKYLRSYQKEEIQKAQKAHWRLEFARMGMGLSGLVLIFGMIFILVHGWIHHWVTLGDFTQVAMQTFWLMGWIWYISFQLTIYTRELGTIKNSLSLIRKEHDLIDKVDAKPIHIQKGEIVFDRVSFGYHQRRLIFKDFNLTIPAGQKVGLVGYSGSGKSTFVNLILRFYDLNEGAIRIDGQNIADCSQDSLRKQIAMIPQDPSLFHRSLYENIRYGRLQASEAEVLEASQLAHCHEFIEKLEKGYDTLVGERGMKLSGGQRQRIAIARAMLKNAPILILDEATSSLDSVTEQLIQDSLNFLMKGRTTLVVAHRLSTLNNMDRILVFHKGKIVEDGRQEELLKAKGEFATLWNMQIGGFLPDGDTEDGSED